MDLGYHTHGRVHRLRGLSLVQTDARLREQALHVLFILPWTVKWNEDLQTALEAARGGFAGRVFLHIGSSQQMLQRFLALTRGRLLVSHNLAVDQAVLRRWFQGAGVNHAWPLPFPGLDTLRCERRGRTRTLGACYARLHAPPLPKAMLTDALKVLALARHHGGTLAALQRLARQQMEARHQRLVEHPGNASLLSDPRERARALRQARRIFGPLAPRLPHRAPAS